jgi:hypothetical protein
MDNNYDEQKREEAEQQNYQPPPQEQPQQQQPQPPQPGQTVVYVNQQEAPPRNGIGTAGFILALLGLIFCWVPGLGLVLGVIGLILSLIGLSRRPRGLAIAGVCICAPGLILGIIIVAGMATALSTYSLMG